MKKLALIMTTAFLICFSATVAQAVPVTSPFLAYDDFVLTFGTQGNPGSAGGVFTAEGKILEYSNPLQVDGWFVLSGTSSGAVLEGAQYHTTYTGSLIIYREITHITQVWSGTGSVETIVNVDGSTFPAIYPRPLSFSDQPTNYNSIGSGYYGGSGSADWSLVSDLNIFWFGSYNWTYDVSLNGNWTPDTTQQYGNIQGGMSVPEPASLLLLGLGLVGLAGVGRRFKK